MPDSISFQQPDVAPLDLSGANVLLNRPSPEGEPLDDPAAAVAAALASPLNFPPLQRAVTPDDRVALALAPGVPQAEAIIAGVVYALTEAGIAAGNITVLLDAAEARLPDRDVTAGLPDYLREEVRVFAHDPHQRDHLAYLAASEAGEAIYFHREIGDADLVIPIGPLLPAGVLGGRGISAGLYPTFADAAAQRRCFAASASDVTERRRHDKQSDEAAWLLGIMLTVGVLPASGTGVMQVLAGDPQAVSEQAERLAGQAWAFDVAAAADLVVASVEGGPEQQSWNNLARALHAAAAVVDEEGAIVLRSTLSQRPGSSMQRLGADLTSDETLQAILSDEFEDTLAASEFARVVQSHAIYLQSKLDAEAVESLGLAHVSSDEEIARLSQRRASCVCIGGAQFAVPKRA